MHHLSPDTLIDLAEGTRADASEPHLAVCEHCHHELAGLRAALWLAADAGVPEPSPLFWDHLSTRIKAAVEQEAPARPRWELLWSPWRIAAVAAAGVVLLASVLTFRTSPDVRQDRTTSLDAGSQVSATEPPPSVGDDPSLDLIVDLAGDLEWDDAAEAPLVVRGDLVEQAVRDLSSDERIELQRVLREAIDGARAGGRGV